jgi:hypothetical protein
VEVTPVKSSPLQAKTPSTDPELMSEVEAAKFIHQERSTLPVWRSKRRGPAYFKIGRKIFYSRADLVAWITSLRIEPKGRAR